MFLKGRMMTRRMVHELENLYREIPALSRQANAYAPLFSAWKSRVESLLETLYGAGSEPLERFRSIYFTPLFLSCRLDEDVFPEAFRDGLEEAGRLLEELLDRRDRHST